MSFKPGSRSWKQFMSYVYGIGGAIVIVGAMFKITHWPGATIMLVGGLGIEAVIFILSVLEPIHEEYDWSLAYPELALGHGHDDDEITELSLSTNSKGGSLSQELDGMLVEAKIDSELIQSLGDGMRNLSETAGKISNVAEASAVSADYTESLKNAAEKVDKLADSYTQASESLMGITDNQKEGNSFGEQMQKVTGNLSALNNVYEMQLKGASESLENTQKIQSDIGELMGNLADSVENTRAYKTNIAELSKNLSALNKVYGNMLNAMNINPNN
jgi:gliding motility-associated protein GldL